LRRHALAQAVEDFVERHPLGLETTKQGVSTDGQSMSDHVGVRLTGGECRQEQMFDPPSDCFLGVKLE